MKRQPWYKRFWLAAKRLLTDLCGEVYTASSLSRYGANWVCTVNESGTHETALVNS